MVYSDLGIWYFLRNKQSDSVTSRGVAEGGGGDDSIVANNLQVKIGVLENLYLPLWALPLPNT